MQLKRDPIFWAAAGILAVAVALGSLVDERFFLLMVASYLLRPTVHSLGFARRLIDERQLQIQYQASNVALAAMVIGNIVVMLILMAHDDHTWEKLGLVLMVALLVRALAGLLMVGDPAVAGPRILVAVGAFLCLFGALDGGLKGFAAVGTPGLVIIALGVAARKRPSVIAYVSFGIAAIMAAFFAAFYVKGRGHATWGTIAAALVIISPIVVAAICLLRAAAAGDEEPSPVGA